MLSPTLQEGLKAYAIGPKIRSIRLKKKMGLVELGRHTGLSPAMLSKIERGQLFPTLPTLLRIAMVFSVGLDYFIAAERDKPLPKAAFDDANDAAHRLEIDAAMARRLNSESRVGQLTLDISTRTSLTYSVRL